MTSHHRHRHQIGRLLMWGLIAVFAMILLTVVVLRLDPGVIGPVAGIFILGCLLLCVVMALLDTRQSRITRTILYAGQVEREAASVTGREEDGK